MGDRFQTRTHDRILAAIAGLALVFGGCGAEEEHLKPDEGVSPFFTGKEKPVDEEGTVSLEGTNDVRPVTKLAKDGKAPVKSADGAAPKASSNAPENFSFEDLDNINKAAIKLGEKGDLVQAARLFDQVLGAEPLNRLALFGRATVGTDLITNLSEQDRATEIGRAAELMRSLKKTYKTLTPREANAYGIVLFNEAAVLGNQGQADAALNVLKEAIDSGFSKWDMMEGSPAFKDVRSNPRYRELLGGVKASALKIARERVKDRLALPVSFPFQFKLKDPDGKVVSSEDLKGKIVVADFWGTWCGPCRQVIPHWIEMHRKFADQGLAIVGIAREKVEPELAKTLVKEFIRQVGVPYICVMGDDETEAQVPDFSGYPTVVILDETGKVRFRSVGAEDSETQAAKDAVMVLLDDMNSKKKPAPAAAPADTAKKP